MKLISPTYRSTVGRRVDALRLPNTIWTAANDGQIRTSRMISKRKNMPKFRRSLGEAVDFRKGKRGRCRKFLLEAELRSRVCAWQGLKITGEMEKGADDESMLGNSCNLQRT
jgi:hypothetical protein